MRLFPALRLGLWLIIPALIALSSRAIERIELTVSDASGAGLSARGISIEMGIPDSHSTPVTVRIAEARLGLRGGVWRDIRIDCPAPVIREPVFSCDVAHLKARGDRFGSQAFDARLNWNSRSKTLAFSAGELRIAAGRMSLAGQWSVSGWEAQAAAVGLDLGAARALLGELAPLDDAWTVAGRVDITRAALAADAAGRLTRAMVDVRLAAASFGNAAGTVAGDGLDGSMAIDARRDAADWLVSLSVAAEHGEALLGRGYWNFGGGAARLRAQTKASDRALSILSANLQLGKLLNADLRAELPLKPAFSIASASLEIGALDLAAVPAQTRDGILAGTPVAQLQGQGQLRGHVEMEAGALAALDLTLQSVSMQDTVAKLGVSQLDGRVLWQTAARRVGAVRTRERTAADPTRSGADPRAADDAQPGDAAVARGDDAQPGDAAGVRGDDTVTAVRWGSANLYGIAVGAAAARFAASGGDVRLLEPTKIPILDGGIAIRTLQLRRIGDPAMSVRFDAAIEPISLPLLCKTFGWPEFAGQLSGHIPNLALENGELTLGGNLDAAVFEGTILVSGLKLKDPFGARPQLQASVAMEKLDLAQITGAFSVGKITGRIDGYIKELQLVGWEPVAFDARFYSTPNDRAKKRISQRAVENISSIGGGEGAAAALRRGALRFFKEFNYSKIGITCKLVNDVCLMSGIEPHPPGYYLVKGSGLPRIDVIGSQERVNWLQLAASLEALSTSSPTIGDDKAP